MPNGGVRADLSPDAGCWTESIIFNVYKHLLLWYYNTTI